MNQARVLGELAVPPGNRPEALRGNPSGIHSIRIDDRWRIIFRWTSDGPARMAIVDYHGCIPVTSWEMRMDDPITLGVILVKEYLEPMGISQNAMARAIGVAPRSINEIVHARRSIAPAMSIRFGAFIGQSDEFRHGIQVECDFRKLAGERKKLTDGIRPASTLSRTV